MGADRAGVSPTAAAEHSAVLLPPLPISYVLTVPSPPINSTLTRHFIPFLRPAISAPGLRRSQQREPIMPGPKAPALIQVEAERPFVSPTSTRRMTLLRRINRIWYLNWRVKCSIVKIHLPRKELILRLQWHPH
jgi:hypothetical protein